MKEIVVPYCAPGDFLPCAHAPVKLFKWAQNGYRPHTEAFLCHDGEELKVRLRSEEEQITCRVREDNGPVWCDSCMEFFLRPYPSDGRYLNFEINPSGAMVCSMGEGRQNRIPLAGKLKKYMRLSTTVSKANGFWEAAFVVPFDVFRALYRSPEKPREMYGNFYKCGDETPFPHYGMWNEIQSDRPDFHRPQDFGELIVG